MRAAVDTVAGVTAAGITTENDGLPRVDACGVLAFAGQPGQWRGQGEDDEQPEDQTREPGAGGGNAAGDE